MGETKKKAIESSPHADIQVCNIGIKKEQHDADHRVIQSIIKVLDRVDNIKWGVAKAMAITICIFLGSAAIVGAAVLLKVKVAQLP